MEVKNFIRNVPDVGEGSITDSLVWKWRELDSGLKYINTPIFTRQVERATTGATPCSDTRRCNFTNQARKGGLECLMATAL